MPAVLLGVGAAAFAAGAGVGGVVGRLTATRRRPRSKSGSALPRTPEAFQTRGLEDAVVVVDPLSTGARLATEAQKRGYKLVRALSSDFPERLLSTVPEACKNLEWDVTIVNTGDVTDTVREIRALNYHIVAILIGCESGVEFFDELTEVMPGFPTNGTKMSAARRDKYLMGESVRSAGLRAVRQQECRAWHGDAANFVASLGVQETDSNGAWCVLKPTKSAGTDGVFISKCAAEARDCFDKILGAANVFGEANQTVLVQEFLKGKEYVVDSVSLEGDHKCVAIWEYDKRPVNGAQFVYYGMRLYQSEDGARESKMVEYVHAVLNALGVRHGPTHAEVMWLDGEDAPCLVEVGSRPHGGEGTFIEMVEPIIGYSQVSVMLDAFCDKQYRFKRLPLRPAQFAGASMEVDFVSTQEGILAGYPLLPQVKKLASFKGLEIKVTTGCHLEKTVDFLTTPGCAMLVHKDRKIVEEDRLWLERMQDEGKFYALQDPALVRARNAGFREGFMSPHRQISE